MGLSASACGCSASERVSQKQALAQYADTLKVAEKDKMARASHWHHTMANPLLFPMYVVTLDTFMKMTTVKPQQVLLEENSLIQFTPDMGHTIFVSHQWLGNSFPDRKFEQLGVLQQALFNVLNGKTNISDKLAPVIFGRGQATLTRDDLQAKPLFIWYDYFSCPQIAARSADQEVATDLANAVDSIPAYVELSDFFFIIAPDCKHADLDVAVNYETWKMRGWCRAERAARKLSARATHMVLVESPDNLLQVFPLDSFLVPVGDGQFTVSTDKERVAPFLLSMLRSKLNSYLVAMELHQYRLLNCLQTVILKGLPVTPITDLLTDSAEVWASEAKTTGGGHSWGTVNNFLAQHGFETVSECSENGWTPICYAALTGQPALLQSLLNNKADLDGTIPSYEPVLDLSAGSSLMDICSLLHHNESLQLLLDAKSHPGQPPLATSLIASALYNCVFSDNAEGLSLLLSYGADISSDGCGHRALNLAAFRGSRATAKIILNAGIRIDLLNSRSELGASLLHTLIGGSSPNVEMIDCLIKAKVDVNIQAESPQDPRAKDLMAKEATSFARNGDNVTRTGRLCHLWAGSTPLLLSVASGKFDVALALLQARADVAVCNEQGLTAIDVATLVDVPQELLAKLKLQLTASGQ